MPTIEECTIPGLSCERATIQLHGERKITYKTFMFSKVIELTIFSHGTYLSLLFIIKFILYGVALDNEKQRVSSGRSTGNTEEISIYYAAVNILLRDFVW